MGSVRLKDIAEECGVSIATVSRALNGLRRDDSKTAAVIRQAAREMGYVPNAAALALKTSRSNTIGVLYEDKLDHEYFSALLDDLRREAGKLGYHLALIGGPDPTQTGYVEQARCRNLDGVIIIQADFESPEVARLVSGGGIVSMIRVACIVCLSSAYSGIFQKTGMLDEAKRLIGRLSAKTGAYAASLVTSVLTGVIACNQTLTILLTEQLCRGEYADKEALALDLEDSAVVTAPLIPWSIAGAVPLAAVGAPSAAVLTAFYLILLPLWRLVRGARIRKN